MKEKPIKLIACSTVIHEIRHLLSPGIQTIEMEPGLHLHVDRLRKSLQDKIDEMTGLTGTIILGYGLCSMAAVGLSASDSSLVIPRVDDCIAMFLGSQDAYREELHKVPGTYFLSKGWIDAGVTLVEEFRQTEERLGKRVAEIVKRKMFQQYKRLAYIDMGNGDQDRYRDFSRQAAREFDLDYVEIKGTTKLMEMMLNGPRLKEAFIVAPPGHTVSLGDFKGDG